MNAQPDQNKMVSTRDKINTLRTLLERAKPQIALALPKHLSADRMLRIAMTSIQKTPKLLECTQQSLLGSIIQSAQLGLEPDGVLGQAYLVPFRNNKKDVTECQLIPGYRGLLKLSRNSGELESISAFAVFEGDKFEVSLGSSPHILHIPNYETRDFLNEKEIKEKLRFVYAVAKLRGADPQFEVMPKSAVERIRKRSRSADDGPWVTDYEAMALKTVLKKISKVLPASVELQRALELDNNAEVGIPQEFSEAVIDIEGATVEEPKGKLEELKGKLKRPTNEELDKLAAQQESTTRQPGE